MNARDIHKEVTKEHNGMLVILWLNFAGFWCRIFAKEAYWDKLHQQENALVTHGKGLMQDAIRKKEESLNSLSSYCLSLKNENTKLNNRSNFIVIFITLVIATVFSLFKSQLEESLNIFWWPFVLYLFFILTMLSIERLRVQDRISSNELFINLVESDSKNNV